MKETGIIMSGDHPLKCIDGTKTNTRRVIKPQPTESGLEFATACGGEFSAWQDDGLNLDEYSEDGGSCQRLCPYGQVGDRLWVRETHLIDSQGKVFYRADDDESTQVKGEFYNWKPSIHMPRYYSRITLEITEVRVERVQEMWMKDAIAEGCSLDFDIEHFGNYADPVSKFHILWDSLNAKRGYGWESNPWVWVLSFKLIK